MKYCVECGARLEMRTCGIDGMVPYCPRCKAFRFPMFNSAISAIIFNPTKDKILLIKQYGMSDYILVAGYINQKENAKETLVREIREETGLSVKGYVYNDNAYFARTNTLIHNYAVVAESENFRLTSEVDRAEWIPIDEVLHVIKPHSLAKAFVAQWLEKMKFPPENIFAAENVNEIRRD